MKQNDHQKKPKSPKNEEFGQEGTNKTIPTPKPDAVPSEELLGTKTRFIEKSPYTRG